MDDTVKIPMTLLHIMKKNGVVVAELSKLAHTVKDHEQFYLKCIKILEVSTKLEEKLKNKDEPTK